MRKQAQRFGVAPGFLSRASVPQLLLVASAAGSAIIFILLVVFGRGYGLQQGFYLSVVLAALVAGPAWGATAGVGAVILDLAALLANGDETWNNVLSTSTGVRLASYIAVGAASGYVAAQGRRLLNDSLDVLEHLLALAGRDLTTAALTSQGLELAIVRRLAAQKPFLLLVGEVAHSGVYDTPVGGEREAQLRRIAGLLSARLEPGDELARIGVVRFAIVAAGEPGDGSSATADSFEHALDAAGCVSAFGWALYPDDGKDALSMFSAALDRLHVRLEIRGDRDVVAAVAGY
jgi:GGDEF domain-containing protein